MVRIAKQSDPIRLAELKLKINDRHYLDQAINRIAGTLTTEIINMIEVKGEQR